jgi:hypothetical protein
MPKLKITVFLSPNENFPDDPDASWPRPRGVKLKLTPVRGGADIDLDATDGEGVTSGDGLAPGADYDVEVRGGYATDWTPAGQVSVDPHDCERDVVLVPKDDRWLLPLLLYRDNDAGKQVGISCAKWHYDYGAEIPPGGAPAKDGPFEAHDDGYAYATLWPGTVTLSFEEINDGTGDLKPQTPEIKFQVPKSREVEVTEVLYLADAEVEGSPLGRMSIEPKIETVTGTVSLTGASATIEYRTPSPPVVSSPKKLGLNEKKIWFNDLQPGVYGATLIPPGTFNNWPIVPEEKSFTPERAWPGQPLELEHTFEFETVTIPVRVQAMDGRLVTGVKLEIYGSEQYKIFTVKDGTYEVQLDWGVPLKIRLARNDELDVDGIPLDTADVAEQPLSLSDVNVVVLPFKYGIRGRAVDVADNPVPGAIIDVFDDQQNPAGSVAAGPDGYFLMGTPASGSFYVAPQTDGSGPVTRQLVPVRSIGDAGNVVIPSGRLARMDRLEMLATPSDGETGDGGVGARAAARDHDHDHDGHRHTPEALTDLAAYPVLTEEVSTTTGPPAPASGGYGGGTAGAGYGQAVDQVIRDVLGWRPSGDVAGFQAALNGAFQLREVEGHTEWTWQQRGYSVQADMGALTGAQASIYARAKSALDQILPLLAGITSLNPSISTEQDREAIRTVVTAEIQELVGELALEGGPRIQRVDELFGLLLGEAVGSTDINPDVVQGQLGTLRQRFALTADWIEKVDDERVVTNFRVIVEQILALQLSWNTDRDLLAVIDSRTSLGTVLIWLSRALEAVCESVGDLSFALDSVYIDAAQRQVIELSFGPDQPPLLLSDLLDWILRASQDEGPRLIQDAGKDGVRAFAPVLRRLRGLVKHTKQAFKDPDQPHGLRTPRVKRAVEVLYDQLHEAARLAGLVQLDQPPEITKVDVREGERTNVFHLTLHGANFRGPDRSASAVLEVLNREEIPDVIARHVHVVGPTKATATFRIPLRGPDAHRVNWLLVFVNSDGTQSDPFAVQIH